ncbi:hypothetical protein RF11_07375 [Thelohanellus kitauei]|uniref:Uncharacterized protein n=1 Tax=Thelohanellus kitauei TaxID=669202 RepID=A0A0C2IUY8_THEKT|nr:hypothetical protein RF11_07375 [Thelohanellus kitauei]
METFERLMRRPRMKAPMMNVSLRVAIARSAQNEAKMFFGSLKRSRPTKAMMMIVSLTATIAVIVGDSGNYLCHDLIELKCVCVCVLAFLAKEFEIQKQNDDVNELRTGYEKKFSTLVSSYILEMFTKDKYRRTRRSDIIGNPPVSGKYNELKTCLLDIFSTSDGVQASKIIYMPPLGDQNPSMRLSESRVVEDCHATFLIFNEYFLRQRRENIGS